jgi:hypothetical protein
MDTPNTAQQAMNTWQLASWTASSTHHAMRIQASGSGTLGSSPWVMDVAGLDSQSHFPLREESFTAAPPTLDSKTHQDWLSQPSTCKLPLSSLTPFP